MTSRRPKYDAGLTQEQKRVVEAEIRELRRRGATYADIRAVYGCGDKAIARIIKSDPRLLPSDRMKINRIDRLGTPGHARSVDPMGDVLGENGADDDIDNMTPKELVALIQKTTGFSNGTVDEDTTTDELFELAREARAAEAAELSVDDMQPLRERQTKYARDKVDMIRPEVDLDEALMELEGEDVVKKTAERCIAAARRALDQAPMDVNVIIKTSQILEKCSRILAANEEQQAKPDGSKLVDMWGKL